MYFYICFFLHILIFNICIYTYMFFYIYVYLQVLVFNIKFHTAQCELTYDSSFFFLDWLIEMAYIVDRIPIDNADMSNEKVNLALSLWYLN